MPRNCSLISSIFQKRIGQIQKMKYFADDSAMEFKLKFSLEMIIESLNVLFSEENIICFIRNSTATIKHIKTENKSRQIIIMILSGVSILVICRNVNKS